MEQNTLIAAAGSACEFVDEQNKHIGFIIPPSDPLRLKWMYITRNKVPNTSAIYRRQIALSVGGYDRGLRVSEDFDLFARISDKYALSNINQILTKIRIRDTSITKTEVDSSAQVVIRNIFRLTNKTIDDGTAICLVSRHTSSSHTQKAFRVLLQCAEAFCINGDIDSKMEMRILVKLLLNNLVVVARLQEEHRILAVKIACRFVFKHCFLEVFRLYFVKSMLSIILSKRVRNVYKTLSSTIAQVSD